ncbi:MAG: hypothetical protein M1814_004063 [Vezdaea aestivalis]|nr:MAG: hypothetical protein M1814_004063 [Vezdaea aestivalis]
MRTAKVSSSLQKTYDECFLKCSTAVYFEGQANEKEALRNWRTVEDRINEFNAYGLPSGYRPRSETEKALQESLADMHLQAKERINILEALRMSRIENSSSSNGPQSGFSRPMSRPNDLRAPASTSLGDGTIRPVDYSEISRPAPLVPPRPVPLPRTNVSQPSTRPASQSSAHLTPSASPSPYAAPVLPANPRSSSRTPSPSKEKKEGGLRMTLRDGRDKKRDSKSRISGQRKESGVAAAKAASQAWTRPSSGLSQLGQGGSSSTLNLNSTSQRTSFDEPSGTQALPGAESSRAGRKYSSDFNSQGFGSGEPYSSRNNSLSNQNNMWAASSSYSQPPPDAPISYRNAGQASTSSANRPYKPQPPPPRLARGSAQAPKRGERVSQDSERLSPSRSFENTTTRRKPVANSSSPRNITAPGTLSKGSSSSSIEMKPPAERVSRKSPRRSRQERSSTNRQVTPPSSDSDLSLNNSADQKSQARAEEMLESLPKGVDPQAAKQIFNEIVIHGDEVHWTDVAGLDIAKNALKEAVVYPFLRPDLFMGLREPARGMLLFGPPGTGKTMLARAVATESKSTFFSISASSLTSKYLGESEKLVRALFSLAKALAPSIIFVDEIDSLLSTRSGSGEHEATRRIKTEFLIQWSDLQRAAAGSKQGAEKGDASRVLVLAATNLPWAIDEAARRRFVRRQYIPLPENHVRAQQLKTLIGHQKHDLREQDIMELVRLTDGFSGSDITALAKDAAMGPLRSLGEALLHMQMDQIRPIGLTDFKASLINIRPSVSKEGLKQFEDWAKEFGERGG